MSEVKLTKAARLALSKVPDEWDAYPSTRAWRIKFERLGLIEGARLGMFRRTDLGRSALAPEIKEANRGEG
ncbi:hypothetical protein [Methylobacterium sp. CM6247]